MASISQRRPQPVVAKPGTGIRPMPVPNPVDKPDFNNIGSQEPVTGIRPQPVPYPDVKPDYINAGRQRLIDGFNDPGDTIDVEDPAYQKKIDEYKNMYNDPNITIGNEREPIDATENFGWTPQVSGKPYFSWVWDGTKWNQKFNSNGSNQMGAPSPGPAPTQPGTAIGEETGGQKQQPYRDSIKRDVGIEKNRIDMFRRKRGKSPETKEDWLSILKMTYPKQLPKEFIKYLNK